MKTVVIMPGGFHPFHAGHIALYNQAVEAFPGADVYVAATDDTSKRTFPFVVKEKRLTNKITIHLLFFILTR
jgi:cytidyltransferase-like protein